MTRHPTTTPAEEVADLEAQAGEVAAAVARAGGVLRQASTGGWIAEFGDRRQHASTPGLLARAPPCSASTRKPASRPTTRSSS